MHLDGVASDRNQLDALSVRAKGLIEALLERLGEVGCTRGRRPACPAVEQPGEERRRVAGEPFAEEETGGQAEAQADGRDGGQGPGPGAGAYATAPHAVNLIGPGSPAKRTGNVARMSSSSSRLRSPEGQLALTLLVLLAGLALFFWLAPETPVVAPPLFQVAP